MASVRSVSLCLEGSGPGAKEEPGATALQDDHPASAAPLSVSLAQLGAMDADLLQVGNTFARSDAAFLRLVSRWHPVAVPVV